MRRIASIIVVSLALTAAGQAQQSQQTPLEQALFQRLNGEIDANIRANAKLIELQQQLATAQEAMKASQAKQKPSDAGK
jgi:hypothetical protein